MLWVKGLHIIFMVTWFAGLFYLPRLFVYHADAIDDISHDRFVIMEYKLFVIMTLGALLTAVFGTWLLVDYAWVSWGHTVWLPAKLVLVGMLVVFHLYCLKIMRELRARRARHSAVFYRWINEIPALLLVAIVLLVVTKPV